ncbi:MAG: putative sulfate exporter family transporter [Ferruginibacter sp.]
MIKINNTVRKIIFITAALCCITPYVEAPLALLLGFILSQTIGHPFPEYNQRAIKKLLPLSVIGLGFGMNIHEALKAGKEGLVFTMTSIALTLITGIILGRLFSVNKKSALLISSGTAVCGGSAIAAVAPIIEADKNEMSVSLATIFILNSVALFVFPVIGHYFNLSQSQFGLWAAVAIHDTSSVVGAAHRYGDIALQVATTIKLERVLWLIPISLIISIVYKHKTTSVKIPWFILFFIAAMLVNTFIPELHTTGEILVAVAKKGLTLTLFLIGAGLTTESLKAVGVKPLLLGLILWILVSVISLAAILEFV